MAFLITCSLCRRRHNDHYADLWIMPRSGRDRLRSNGFRLARFGIIHWPVSRLLLRLGEESVMVKVLSSFVRGPLAPHVWVTVVLGTHKPSRRFTATAHADRRRPVVIAPWMTTKALVGGRDTVLGNQHGRSRTRLSDVMSWFSAPTGPHSVTARCRPAIPKSPTILCETA
jgi:hypothetical protein